MIKKKMMALVSVTELGNLLDFGQFESLWQQLICHKSSTFLGNFCKGVKIFSFSSEIIFGQLLKTFGNFLLVTLVVVMGRTRHKKQVALKIN